MYAGDIQEINRVVVLNNGRPNEYKLRSSSFFSEEANFLLNSRHFDVGDKSVDGLSSPDISTWPHGGRESYLECTVDIVSLASKVVHIMPA